ncbi:MAG: hypothetical protein QOE11_1230, partial [Solirubrobacteraceae bacterium]|nr:hypothetical protein [Solirubrobacteraceae bacterium]
MTVLYGPSGVGKSSLLHAGVVHRLREQARPAAGGARAGRPRTAVVIVDDWTGDPVSRLATRIQALGAQEGADSLPVEGDGPSLLEAVKAHSDRRRGGLLLILDQFEEYTRLHPDPAGQPLDDVLPELIRQARTPVRLLFAIREDRLADLDRFGGRIPQLLGNVLRLGPMSPSAALEAIEGPIERCAAWAREAGDRRVITLEPGLAEKVRDELVALGERRRATPSAAGSGGEPHVEPSFLQLVMRRLWDEDVVAGRADGIHLATLARLGGAAEIVATHLDTALTSLPGGEQDLAAEMLRFLVTPSGATACLTARDLSTYVERPEPEIQALAEKLSRPPARILRGVAAEAASGAGGYELPQVLAEPALEWATRRRTSRLEERARRLLAGLVAMTAVAIALVGYTLHPEPLRRLEGATVDTRFEVRGARPADRRIVLVTLDRATHDRVIQGPPSSRATFARGLLAIARARPLAVASDLIFTGAGISPAGDRALTQTIHSPLLEHRLVLATDRFDDLGRAQLLGSDAQTFDGPSADDDPELQPLGPPAVGYAGVPPDPGQVARRIERGVGLPGPDSKKLDTLAVATAQVAEHVRFDRLPRVAWIDYRGARGTIPRVAFSDVLAGRPDALAKLRDRIVVLGNNGNVKGDLHDTSAP